MNWKEIRKKYTESIKIYDLWNIDADAAFNRSLYDFFDERGIYIEVLSSIGDDLKPYWFWSINYIHKDDKVLGWSTAELHIDRPEFLSRIKAEEDAFMEAFEILEKKL